MKHFCRRHPGRESGFTSSSETYQTFQVYHFAITPPVFRLRFLSMKTEKGFQGIYSTHVTHMEDVSVRATHITAKVRYRAHKAEFAPRIVKILFYPFAPCVVHVPQSSNFPCS